MKNLKKQSRASGYGVNGKSGGSVFIGLVQTHVDSGKNNLKIKIEKGVQKCGY
jgi:hypothetical protein